MPHLSASDLSLHCLPMSHKKYARLIWVKTKSADDNNNMKNYSACNKLRSCDLKMATVLSLMSFHQLDLI